MDFIDLRSQQLRIRSGVDRRIATILDHGKYILGPEIDELEQLLARYVGVKHCISCSNGTDALLMPLMAYGIGPGDAVFVPAFTFFATAEVVAQLGATPVFVDVEYDTFNIDVKDLRRAIESVRGGRDPRFAGLRPKAIIPVDLFGQPAEYDQIIPLAREHNLTVIEDFAQSFGATYHGVRTGAFGDVAATSFFPAKPLGCYGDGGAIFTNNDELATSLRSIRVHGQGKDKYENVRIGINGRLDTMQAAVLLEKMTIFDDELELRNRVAARYEQGLRGVVTPPTVGSGRTSVWAQYSLLTTQRDALSSHLKTAGIPSVVYYSIPLHLQKAFQKLGYKPGDLPVAEQLSGIILSLPMHPYLTADDQDRIIWVIRSAAEQLGIKEPCEAKTNSHGRGTHHHHNGAAEPLFSTRGNAERR